MSTRESPGFFRATFDPRPGIHYKPSYNRLRRNALPEKKPKRLILLDYDGTLLPLHRRIDRSFLPPTTRRMLRRLSQKHPVVFVTGRDLRDLRRLAGPLQGMGLIGTHGIEVSGLPGLRLAPTPLLQRFIQDRKRLVTALRGEFAPDQGVFLQVKRYALSLHFPHQGCDEEKLRARFRRIVRKEGTKGLWEFQIGKHMIDLRPKGFSKAMAVRELLKRFPGREVLFAGDDRSDLPVFRLLRGKALLVGVGPVVKAEDCNLWFPTPAMFVRWLGKL